MTLLLLLLACTGRIDPSETCTVTEGLGAGRGAGTLADESWDPEGVTYSWAGSSLQFNAPPHDGYAITLVAMSDMDGVELKEAIAGGDFPIHVTLLDGADGGFATVYPDKGDSLTTDLAAGGSLQVLRQDADAGLVACFDFEAGSEAGEKIVMENGQIRANPL